MKPVVFAAVVDGGVEAFVGPAFLSSSQPLATLAGRAATASASTARHVSDVFVSGPDLGLDVTAVFNRLAAGRRPDHR